MSVSEHPTTIIMPSALFTHARKMSPIPSKYSTAQAINQLVNASTGQNTMLSTPPYTFQSSEYFHSPAHTFVLPYVATAPHLALDESLDGPQDEDEDWIGYGGSKTPDFMDENSNPSTPYFVESDLSTISDARSVIQQYDEADCVERTVERSITFPARASIFEEPQTVMQSIKQSINPVVPDDLPQLEAVPCEPASRPVYQPSRQSSQSVIESLKSSRSSKSSNKSSKNPSITIPSSQSVIEYSSDMSRSLAIVKGTRSYGDLQSLKKWAKHKSKKGPKKASGQGEQGQQGDGDPNQQHNPQQNNQQNNQQGGGDPNQGQNNDNGQGGPGGQDPNQFNNQGNTPNDNGAGGAGDGDKKKRRSSGGGDKKRKRETDGEGSDSSGDDSDSSSEEEVIDEHGNKIRRRKDKSKRLKTLSKRERNKLSAKAYRQRKKNATCQLSEKNIALQRVVDQQVRMLADAQLEAERMKEQLGVLQSLLSVKISDLWQSRPKSDLPPSADNQASAVSASRSTGSGSPLAPIVPPLSSSVSPALHSPETSGFPSFAALQASVQQGSALAMREGEEFKLSSLSQQPSMFGQPPFMPQGGMMSAHGGMPQPGVLNQRTGMFLLALFSCFLLFNPGSRRSADMAMPPPHPGHEEPSTPSEAQHQTGAGVLSALAEAAIKSETDTSPTMSHPMAPGLNLQRPNMPVVQPIKNEGPMSHDQMAAYLASSVPGEFPQVRIPLLVDAQGVLHEWLVTADEHAMAQMRALTYEPLVRALGQDIANRAIREFAASFARQLG